MDEQAKIALAELEAALHASNYEAATLLHKGRLPTGETVHDPLCYSAQSNMVLIANGPKWRLWPATGAATIGYKAQYWEEAHRLAAEWNAKLTEEQASCKLEALSRGEVAKMVQATNNALLGILAEREAA
jgi:hypothetical protein